MSDKPSTTVTENAKNPDGQRSTMAGTTGKWDQSSQDMKATKTINIQPNSELGCKLHK